MLQRLGLALPATYYYAWTADNRQTCPQTAISFERNSPDRSGGLVRFNEAVDVDQDTGANDCDDQLAD